jgi:uncharacterized protein YraI
MKIYSFADIKTNYAMKKQLTQVLSTLVLMFLLAFNCTAQTSSMPGYVNGDNVNLRADHTTQSRVVTMLARGQRISIISSYRPEGNYNEAILRASTDFYDANYGNILFSLPKGKAVVVGTYDGGMYNISFRNDMTGRTGYARIDSNRLEFIGGDSWYFVEVNGFRGWIFGKYVAYY